MSSKTSNAQAKAALQAAVKATKKKKRGPWWMPGRTAMIVAGLAVAVALGMGIWQRLPISVGSKKIAQSEQAFASGNLHFEQGDLATAVQHYRAAVAFNPFHADAWTNLGNALSSAMQYSTSQRTALYDEAVKAYTKAIGANSRHIDAQLALKPSSNPFWLKFPRRLKRVGTHSKCCSYSRRIRRPSLPAMYGLRQINNGYSDFAGTRSDYVIVGHPQYNLGKKGFEDGFNANCAPGREWDTTPIPHSLPRSLVGDRLRREGVRKHIMHLSNPTPLASYKERALSKSRSLPGKVGGNSSSSQARGASSTGSIGGLDSFLRTLEREELPKCVSQRVTAGYANHIRSQPIVKHYASMQDELSDLTQRLRLAPEQTKTALLQDDCWKYYANYMEQANLQEAKLKKCLKRSLPSVTAAMTSQSPVAR